MAQHTPPDPLDSLLSLEDQYHNEGYALGLADGARAGRIEGRTFGLEKGYEKVLEMGRLAGKAAVYNARIRPATPSDVGSDGTSRVANGDCAKVKLKPIEATDRLRKHIRRFCDLTDSLTLSTENSEDAVEEFDSRLKDARAKATLVSRAVGEDGKFESATNSLAPDGDFVDLRLKVVKGGRSVGKPRAGGEMEDFGGVMPISKSKGDDKRED